MSGKKVVIIGTGCSGLAAAYTLKKQNVDFVLLEASNRYGGRVGTEYRDGYTYARGHILPNPNGRLLLSSLKSWGYRMMYLN